MADLSMDVGRLRLRPGDRVRHVCDPAEGIVETMDDAAPIPTATVRLDEGDVVVSAAGFWERVEGWR